MSTISEVMKEMIRQQILTLHTCLVCKVLRVYEDGTAKVHPLTMLKTKSGEVRQHQALDGVPISDQVKSTIRVGCVCIVVFAERDIAKALSGDYALPSLARHHSLSDGLIIGTVGEVAGEDEPEEHWYAPLSAETNTAKTTVKDSETDDGKEIYVDVKCDPAEDNLLYATSDGLYAPGYTKEEIDDRLSKKSQVSVTQIQKAGTKIATITVNGTAYDVYAPKVPSQEQTDAWTAAAEQAHTHANKDVLDDITAAYTEEEQEKLSGIEDGANKYVHPNHTAYSSGLYKVAVDGEGHVTLATAVTKNDITALGIPEQDTCFELERTPNCNYLNFREIVSIGEQQNEKSVNIQPTLFGYKNFDEYPENFSGYIPIISSSKEEGLTITDDLKYFDRINVSFSKSSGYLAVNIAGGLNLLSGGLSTIDVIARGRVESSLVEAERYSGANATQSEQGLMSAEDKAKLDGIETGANKIIVDSALSDASTNPVQNKAVKTALDEKAASNHTHDYLPLSGGTMNSEVTIEIPNNDGRSMTLSASNAAFKAPSGSWAMGLTYRESDGTTTLAQIGAKGTGDTIDYLYFGGTYSNPILKVTPDGTLSANIFLGDLSGNAASAAKLETARKINGVSFDGTSDITAPLYSGYACDDGAAWSDAPWHKIASTAVTASYQDVVTTMYVTRGQSGNDTSGILRARVRAGSSASVIESASLSWLLAGKSINTQNFIMVCKANSNGELDIEVWVKLATRYEGWQYYMIGSGYRTSTNATLWKLYQSGTGTGSASHTDSGTVYTSTISQIQNPHPDTGWVNCTLNSDHVSDGTIQYRVIGKQITISGTGVVLAADTPSIYNAPWALATCNYDFSSMKTITGIGMFGGKPVTIRLGKYNSDNLIMLYADEVINAGSANTGYFSVTGFVD